MKIDHERKIITIDNLVSVTGFTDTSVPIEITIEKCVAENAPGELKRLSLEETYAQAVKNGERLARALSNQ